MPAWAWIVIAAAAVAVILLLVIASLARRRAVTREAAALRRRYGSEYERVADEHGDRRAVAELERREQLHERLNIVPLEPGEQDGYRAAWIEVQEQFVDAPSSAILRADRLVQEVMARRGYPVQGFEQRAADLSIEHPDVVVNYRAAHAIARADADNNASTEQLRQAIIHYRALFEELLGAQETAGRGISR
jgi:hypothetical protein